MARLQWRLRTLMAVVLYVAIDCSALSNAIWYGSDRWLLLFLLLTFFVPLNLGLWRLLKRIDRTGNTLY